MNQFFKSIAVFSFMLLSFIAKANDNEPKLIFETEEDAKSTMVFELDAPAEESSVQLVDAKGHILFIEDIAKKVAYIKKFNLSNLVEGTYELTTDNAERSVVYKLSVKDGNARLIETKTIAKPIFKMNSNKVFLKIPANGKKKVFVSIYNASGELVHEERFKSPTTSTKVFNLTGSEKGEYNIRVWNSNGMYMRKVEVN